MPECKLGGLYQRGQIDRDESIDRLPCTGGKSIICYSRFDHTIDGGRFQAQDPVIRYGGIHQESSSRTGGGFPLNPKHHPRCGPIASCD